MTELRKRSDGWQIVCNGRVIVDHRTARPALFVGSGDGAAHMDRGNFRIRDRRCQRIDRAARVDGDRVLLGDVACVRLRHSPEQGHQSGSTPGQSEIIIEPLRPQLNRVWLALECAPHERVWGCGIQYSHVELRGRRVPIWVREQGVGRGHDPITLYANLHSRSGGAWHTTYFPQPNFVSSAGWFAHVDVDAYSEFDFRPRTRIWIHCWQLPVRCIVGICEGVADAIGGLSALLGRQPSLPDWVWNGVWLGVQGGTQTIQRKLERAREAGVAVGALWVQDWVGKRETAFGRQLMWNWEYDRHAYPDLPQTIASLRLRGIGFLGYINPFLAIEGSLYREASRRGYCVQSATGGDHMIVVTTFPAALLDLTNVEAVDWIRQIIIDNMIGIGMAGWMADYGEYLPVDVRLHDGRSAWHFHNRYPREWARVNHQALERSGTTDAVVFFMRAGFSGSSAYAPSMWGGDQLVNWSRHDGLPSAVAGQISAGFGAAGNYHSDIGGYTSLAWVRRRKELFMRWCEQAALSPIMRTHEGNRPDSNWQFDSDRETLAHLARMTALFCHLKPYHRALQQEYQRHGLPPTRHVALHYADGTNWHEQRSYLYGRDLYVAPVLRPGRHRRTVHLPQDDWVHLWSGRHLGAGRHTISAPLGQPPIFYRRDSHYRDLFDSVAGTDRGRSVW